MPQTGAAEFPRSDRHGDSPPAFARSDRHGDSPPAFARSDRQRDLRPAPIVGFDPVGEIAAYDNRGGGGSRAAALAALAEAFAAEFGIDEASPSAASLADRFGFRFEDTGGGPAGRRTITITGHGAVRSVPPAERSVGRGGGAGRRRGGPVDPLPGSHADRVALWAVGMAIVLALVAAISAQAIPLP